MLFVITINDLYVADTNMWKYVDDTTISENIWKHETSKIQSSVDELIRKSRTDEFQLNEAKCKELRITFARPKRSFTPIVVNGKPIDVVSSAKVLGVNISQDLKWNIHISQIVKKVSSRLYFLRQQKRAKIPAKELITFSSLVCGLLQNMLDLFFMTRYRNTYLRI